MGVCSSKQLDSSKDSNKLQKEYKFLKKHIDSKLKTEGLNNIEKVKIEIQILEKQINSPEVTEISKLVKKERLNILNGILRLSEECQNLLLELKREEKNNIIQNEKTQNGISSKKELLEKNQILNKILENPVKEEIQHANELEMTRSNKIKYMMDEDKNFKIKNNDIDSKLKTSAVIIDNLEKESIKDNVNKISKKLNNSK